MKNSKKGVAMAYTIMATTFALLLLSALISAATFNMEQTDKSMESRQAYLNARGAVEYARALFGARLQTAQNLTDLGVGTPQTVYFNPDAPDSECPYALASYAGWEEIAQVKAENNGADTILSISASGRYRTHQNAKNLGYQAKIQFAQEGSGAENSFMITGPGFGTTPVYHSTNPGVDEKDEIRESAKSVYPVVFTHEAGITGANVRLEAPEFYFMMYTAYAGDTRYALSDYNGRRTLRLAGDFICFNGAVKCADSVNPTDGHTNLYIEKKGTILYFGDTSQIIGGYYGQCTIPQGFYKTVKDNQNLFDILVDQKSKELNDPEHQFKLSDHLVQIGTLENPPEDLSATANANLSFLLDLAQDPVILNQIKYGDISGSVGAGWVKNGKFSGGKPTKHKLQTDGWQGEETNWPFNVSYDSNSYVYTYVTDASGWGVRGVADPLTELTYISKQMTWLYVNDKDNWAFPDEADVVFQAESITIQTEAKDGEIAASAAKRPRIEVGKKDNDYKQWIVKSPNEADPVKLYFPYAVELKKEQDLVNLRGNFNVPSGTDLFALTVEEWESFADGGQVNNGNSGGGGSGGGSGSGAVAGGLGDEVYTDG